MGKGIFMSMQNKSRGLLRKCLLTIMQKRWVLCKSATNPL